MSRRILVTGGAGFIGSHLVEALMARGDDVTVLDDFSTSKWPFGSKIVKGSIMDSALVQELMADCHQVYHLAAIVGVKNVFEHPLNTLDINILGTNNVLKHAALAGKKALFTSSSEVYGNSGAQRQFEFAASHIDSVSDNHRSVYGLSKLAGEQMALMIHAQLGLKVVIARLFNTIGPRQVGTYGMVVPRFVERAIKGEALEVYDGGNQVRTFIDVRDTVRALMNLMDSDIAEGGVFNVGGSQQISIYELARMVCKIAGTKAPIYSVPSPYGVTFGDHKRRMPDTSKIKKVIGFEPQITLEQTIKDVLDFFRDQLGGRVAA